MILEKIVAATRTRVERMKELLPLEKIKEKAFSSDTTTDFSFEKALRKKDISFICEVKRASPSKGMITEDFPYLKIAEEYENAGADALSVLTEPKYFKGGNKYLAEIKDKVSIPVLRKDFIIDPYQIYESKVLGASAILLICALLDTRTLSKYLSICHELGLSALVEAHNEAEVESALETNVRIIGINNRNLNNFSVNISNSIRLRDMVPDNIVFVSESGIKTPEDVEMMRKAKVDGVLIGETLMRSLDKKHMLEYLRGNSYDKN